MEARVRSDGCKPPQPTEYPLALVSAQVLAKGLDLVLSVPGLLVCRESKAASSATVALEQGHGGIGETNLPELFEGA